jgi:hypothetical protein
MPKQNLPNGWNEWSRHVLSEIVRLSDNYEKLAKEFVEYKLTVGKEFEEVKLKLEHLDTAFNIKSGIWGVIGGLIPTVGIILFELLKKKTVIP